MRIILFLLLFVFTHALTLRAEESADEAFEGLSKRLWESRLHWDPLFATRTGDYRFNDRLPVVSVATAQNQRNQLVGFRDRLQTIDRSALSATNQINFDILLHILETEIAESDFRSYLIPITNREGFHINFPELRRIMPLNNARDFRNYINRLRGFRSFAGDHIAVMRQGIKEGFTLPSVVLERFNEPIDTHLVDDPTTSLFYEPLEDLPASISQDEAQQLRESAARAIKEGIIPGYRDFLEFMRDEYVPSARGSLGASALPNGREFYRHRIRRFTTLDLTPDEVHALGLSEVKRIRSEMEEVIREVGFEGDVPEFAQSLRDNEEFHAKTPEQLMKETAFVLKRMDGQLPRLFRTLPRTPYGIRKVPDYIAPQTTTAYYMPPAGDGSRAGFYFVNTYDLKSRPLYGVQALSLHEAVPGHHLQLALQQEMQNLPPFRRFAGFTVFIEGWALYAERLGLEVGFYEDPYSNFGRLTYEMWRACRLVVDTGIHYLGWTRKQAIDFMAQNTALSLHNIRSEVDRYIAWPGQALAYKIGELKIRELREFAEAELESEFDVREFHDVVLNQGSVPLQVLENQVKAWVAEFKN